MGEKEVAWLTRPSLDRFNHVCIFYRNTDEEYGVLSSFISEGFKKGDKAFHIIDEKSREDHLQRLQKQGVDVTAAEQTGQLEVRSWENAYMRSGCFDQYAMLALVEEALDGFKRQGFPFTRLVGNMDWALEECPGVSHLVEYCARVNYIAPKFNTTIICAYDLSRFSAAVVVDVLRTHPAAVIGGIVQENPYYVMPDELIQELHSVYNIH